MARTRPRSRPLSLTSALLFAMIPAAAAARPGGWPAATDAQVGPDEARVQVTRTMTLELPGTADAAFHLFGPVGESEWAPTWKPAFIAPTAPAQSADGAVFTTGPDSSAILWVMTDYDPVSRIVRYVHVKPGEALVQLWIEVRPSAPELSYADVTYRYTALGAPGREAIDHFVQVFPSFKRHWQEAISEALTKGSHGHHH